MNVVDSSGWLEYLADGPNAGFFAGALQDTDRLIVPTISVLEVFKCVLQQRGEDAALQTAAAMQQGELADLTLRVALEAARLGHNLKLPLADSVMLATARLNQAVLWTQDADFKGLEGVRYVAKRG
jgi:predicted nucleic acid-binding protein